MILNILIIFSSLAFAEQSCPKGSHWVEAFKRNAYYKADGTYVSSARVSGHCRKNQRRRAELKDAFVFGIPKGWPHKVEKPKKWKKPEINRVLDSLEMLPDILWPKAPVEFYRLEKSEVKNNPATSARQTIVLYDYAFKASKEYPLTRVIAHELAHELYREFKDNDKDKFAEYDGWVEVLSGEARISGRLDESRVYEDSQLNPAESFSNAIEAYLFDRARLKSKEPHLYKWIKNKYGDKINLRTK